MTKFIIAACAVPMLFLAACDGYEPVRVNNLVPYSEGRTAGSGIMYVRAAMLPAKGPVTEPVMETVAEPVVVVVEEPILISLPPAEAEKVFTTKQGK